MKSIYFSLLLGLSLFAGGCGNSDDGESSQSSYGKLKVSEAAQKQYLFKFELLNENKFIQLLNTNETPYLVNGTVTPVIEFANELNAIACGISTNKDKSVVKRMLLDNKVIWIATNPRFATMQGRDYVKFKPTKNGEIEIICSRNYVKGIEITIDDVRHALTGYFKIIVN